MMAGAVFLNRLATGAPRPELADDWRETESIFDGPIAFLRSLVLNTT